MAYGREEIASALDLLCMPQIGALRRVTDASYTLQMPQSTAARRLRALVRVLESGEPMVGQRERDVTSEQLG